jgi:hypothetical protein
MPLSRLMLLSRWPMTATFEATREPGRVRTDDGELAASGKKEVDDMIIVLSIRADP